MTKWQKRLQLLVGSNMVLQEVFASHPEAYRELASFMEKELWRKNLAVTNSLIGEARELENVCGKDPEDCCCLHRLEDMIGVISNYRKA